MTATTKFAKHVTKKRSVLSVGIPLFFFALFQSILAAAAMDLQKPQPREPVRMESPIARIPYESYSYFLVCSPEWLAAEKATDLKDLYDSFRHFGEAIGDRNTAIIFVKIDTSQQTELADTIDIERNSRLCREWGLVPSHGPFILVTTTQPTLPLFKTKQSRSPALPRNSAVFELGRMKPQEIHILLGRLTDELVEGDRTENLSELGGVIDQKPMGMFARVLDAVRHTINNVGCAWRFRVSAGAIQADLQACATKVG